MLLAKAEGHKDAFRANGLQLTHFVCEHEDEVQPVLTRLSLALRLTDHSRC